MCSASSVLLPCLWQLGEAAQHEVDEHGVLLLLFFSHFGHQQLDKPKREKVSDFLLGY